VKTTIELPDELLVEAKKRAADERTTMREIFERALRKELGTRAARGPRKKPRIHWVVVDGGLPPGLDIASREKMTDWFGDDRT
jgi:hypothetical protein